ncbi:hypothetical protein TTRE_0000080601 [Trichuris trichiura]|uniref:Uncharacterized protein n=1 Tax=Trichuris trichiura TaxID=36087 RepID=A0A077YXN4_TRITR|nr:hypothetical protein TTRE_0000080601 [Trichuris trichiura]
MTNDRQGPSYQLHPKANSAEGVVPSEGSFMGSLASTSSNQSLQIMDTTLVSTDSSSQDSLEDQSNMDSEERRVKPPEKLPQRSNYRYWTTLAMGNTPGVNKKVESSDSADVSGDESFYQLNETLRFCGPMRSRKEVLPAVLRWSARTLVEVVRPNDGMLKWFFYLHARLLNVKRPLGSTETAGELQTKAG